jgi:hypothetical protein
MSVNLSPLGGAGWQFFDNNGIPLAGGLIYSYAAGTSTPLATYTSSSGSTANSNPIILDAAGRPSEEIWLSDLTVYKLILKTPANVQIWSMDNLSGINAAIAGKQDYQIATAGQTIFTVGFSYTVGYDLLNVLVNGSKQIATLNYIETNSTTITFVDGLNVGDVVEFVQ